MHTSDVLNKAADLIEERGWWNGRPTTSSGICALVAIDEAADDTCLSIAADHAFQAHVEARDTPTWNDTPGRTREEVIAALRACAVIEASRERETAEVSS